MSPEDGGPPTVWRVICRIGCPPSAASDFEIADQIGGSHARSCGETATHLDALIGGEWVRQPKYNAQYWMLMHVK